MVQRDKHGENISRRLQGGGGPGGSGYLSYQWKDVMIRDGKVSRSSQFNKLIRCLVQC